MRKGKKYAARLFSLLLSLLMAVSLCLTPVSAYDSTTTTVKQGVLNFFSLMLARSGIALSNLAAEPEKYWSYLQSIISVYSSTKSIDWEKINSEIQYGTNSIRASSDAFNAVNGVVNWIRDSYDISSLQDSGIKIAPIYLNDYSTYVEYIPNYKYPCIRYPSNVSGYNTDYSVDVPGVRFLAIWSDSSEYFSILAFSRSKFSGIKYTSNRYGSWESKYSSHSYGNFYYAKLENTSLTHFNIFYLPFINSKGDKEPSLNELYEYAFGSSAIGSIDSVTPDTLPQQLTDIDSDKSYDLSLQNMKDIDIWKDSNLSSEIGVKNAIDKAIENPVSIDVGNDISVPVAYPISVGEDAAKVPIVVGQEVAADTPIVVPTAVPNDPAVPVPVSPVIPDDPAVYKLPALSTVFPFSVPFDLYKAFTVLIADPVAPSWDMKILGKDYNFNLSFLNPYIGVIHAVIVLLFVVGLIFITRYFVGGQ